jgi:hypothetical protein
LQCSVVTCVQGGILGDTICEAAHDAGDMGTMAKTVVRVAVPKAGEA